MTLNQEFSYVATEITLEEAAKLLKELSLHILKDDWTGDCELEWVANSTTFATGIDTLKRERE